MNIRILLISFVAILLSSCTIPRVKVTPVTETSATAIPTDTALPPLPTPELGLAENPLIMALAPGSKSQEEVDAAEVLTSQFTQRTGYTVVTVVPDSYTALVDALEKGNAHIVLLDPYSYELAYQKGLVQ